MSVPTNIAEIINSLDKRLSRAEQLVTSPAVMGAGVGGNEFDEIYIGLPGSEILLTTVPPEVPELVVATPGVFFSNSFVDVDWDEPLIGSFAGYRIELARKVSGSYQFAQTTYTLGDSIRFESLIPGQLYGVRVQAVNALGIGGIFTDWTDFTASVDLTTPSAPASINIYRGATSVIVKFDESTSTDVINNNGFYEVQVDITASFNTENLRTNRTSATVVSFNDILLETEWHARVRAIDSSGNASTWTTASAITAGNVIDSMIVSGLNAAKITFGSMSGDRITASTLDVNALKTSSLTAKTITMGAGGQIAIGSPPTNGIYINDQGIRAYNASTQTFALDVSGTAVFSGTVSGAIITGADITGGTIQGTVYQSAASGSRVVISQVTHGNAIAFPSGDVTEILSPKLFSYDSSVGGTIGEIALRSGELTGSKWNSQIILRPKGSGFADISLLPGNGTGGVVDVVGILRTSDSGGVALLRSGLTVGVNSVNNPGATVYGDTQFRYGDIVVHQGMVASYDAVYGDICQLNYSSLSGLPYVRLAPVYARTSGSAANVYVDSNGYMWRSTSSLRYKRDVEIAAVDSAVEGLLSLDPKIFKNKEERKLVDGPAAGVGPEWVEEDNQAHIGYIAEEMQEVMGEHADLFVLKDSEGRPDEIVYGRLIVLAVEEIKNLRRRISQIESASNN